MHPTTTTLFSPDTYFSKWNRPLLWLVSVLKSLLMVQSLTSELLSLRQSKWSEGCWLQLMCCTLPKCLCLWFQTRRLTSEILRVFGGPRVRGSEVLRFWGSEVLDSKWFDIRSSKCYRELQLFNSRLALMYNGRVGARMREQEYWNSIIYQKRKDENWDGNVKMRLEFKRTEMEWWRQMKTEMWSGFLEVIQGSQRVMVMHQRSWGLVGVQGHG